MLQNITFRADKEIIKKARDRARLQETSLNAAFKHWLEQYVETPETGDELSTLIERLSYAKAEGTFNREELNER